MADIFVKNLNHFPDGYFVNLDPPDSIAKEPIYCEGGRQYKLVGTYEKEFSFASRFWLAIRSLLQQIVFSVGAWIFINKTLQEEWTIIFTGKQIGQVYCDEEGLDTPSRTHLVGRNALDQTKER